MNHNLTPSAWRLGRLAHYCIVRYTSKINIKIEEQLLEKFDHDEVKPRKHPGILTKQCIQLPKQISEALKRVIGDYPVQMLLDESRKLNQYILARHPPPERVENRIRMRKIIEELDQRKPKPENFNQLSEDEQAIWVSKREKAIKKLMGERNYAWKPIKYDEKGALVYAIGRGAQEFSVLTNILLELVQRDEQFKPHSYFDFGSGVGTGLWAVSQLWRESIFEYYNVDASKDMNELSELILCDGNENQQKTLRNVYYRQFLPALDTKYDLVVSAYTLFELEGAEKRKETVLNLWRKCDQYMILVEEGTRRGSQLINEAKDFLLEQGKTDRSLHGHVFAPCAHDLACPRLKNDLDNTPCNFEITYKPLDVGNSKINRRSTRYSYVVLKKGYVTDETRQWPRIVRPTLSRSKHVICRMCTADARLQEVIFTQSKHGRMAYRCAKASRWGDRLPMEIGKPFSELPPTPEEDCLNNTNDEIKEKT